MAVTILLLFSLLTTPAFTESYSRSITAWFDHFKLQVNDSEVHLNNDVFIYNNEVYVPIREVSDYLYLNYELNQATNTISLKTNHNPFLEGSDTILKNKTFISEIKGLRKNLQSLSSKPQNIEAHHDQYQHNFEVYSLRNQITELERKIQILKESEFPYQKIKTAPEMEAYLKEHFRTLQNIPMSIRFRYVGGSKYIFSAVFDSSQTTKWSSLNRRDIENWVDDIFYVTRELLNPHAEIDGDIRQSNFNYGTEYASYWTRGNHLFFDFRLADHKKNSMVDGVAIENALNSKLKYYNSSTFTYEVFVSQNDIDIIASYKESFDSWSPSLKIQYLNRLKSEVDKLYDHVNINGRIVTGTKKETKLRFSFEENQLHSVDLLDELEDELNHRFGKFYYGGNTFSFTYTVNEGHSGSFEIIMESDFSIDSAAWRNVVNNGEFSFRSFVQGPLYHINTNWDVDIFGTVVDKNLVPVTSLEFFRTDIYSPRTLQPIIFE